VFLPGDRRPLSRSPLATHPAPQLLIVGASTRAAAFSALRAGFQPVCCDQFADADLAAVAQVIRTPASADAVLAASEEWCDLPVVYVGGVENQWELVQALESRGRLLGNPVDVLQTVRNPLKVAETLQSMRLPCLPVCGAENPPPADGTWMLKPLASGGGRGIVRWTESSRNSVTRQRPHYFQARAEGAPYSAVFIAREGVGDVRFVGMTEQLVGLAECGAPEHHWCGNIGPVALSVGVESTIRRLANFLKWKFELRGLFGIDFIVTADDKVAMTEINPRYTASVEILEFATGLSLMIEHIACFADIPADHAAAEWKPATQPVLGKLVHFNTAAPRRVAMTQPLGTPWEWPTLADVPANEHPIGTGEPICTFYAAARTMQECRAQLLSAPKP
jgi:predicted ATP-grasp superfamily ATP-dependent carboligase